MWFIVHPLLLSFLWNINWLEILFKSLCTNQSIVSYIICVLLAILTLPEGLCLGFIFMTFAGLTSK
jgi:hypothetical protein